MNLNITLTPDPCLLWNQIIVRFDTLWFRSIWLDYMEYK